MNESTTLPKLPWDEADGPVFKAPWEASAFAMAVRLSEQGHFSWTEWANHLGAEIEAARRRGESDLGDNYYAHWLAALEKLVVKKGLGSREELGQLKTDWTDSTLATPHGQPIELKRRSNTTG